ncbi:iron complex transport system ATP-binding protein [Desulfotomaculum arcticum]|uniref:Iron complex transport system ATP-binding protein n=1 Tax=Desulfotruncus arcticus DSM 17038 TaxID=1121424 RepID=A0A1I2PAM3_9FIRM|nr:ABC transporter ATP-binding protein [Desulfotruncus arcticus]SFG10696.1 iron complex transport system ATP-binding protein [Desulfotomaculum arcticum] [Desulfotruncus arcticus DSM 17038]
MKLSVKNASFRYHRGRTLFDKVDFSIHSGKIMTILGPNGVGKTTFLRCLMGFLRWTKGETFIDNRPLSSIKQSQLWKRMAYVPQAKGVNFPYTVLEMVLMGRSPHLGVFSVPSVRDKKTAQEALCEIGIGSLAHKACNEISGGELQMVLIARALSAEPGLLILDEPESNLDLRNQLLILDMLVKLARQKQVACIINTHYPQHALRISDQTLLLGTGPKHIFGPTKEIITENNLRDYFGVDALIVKGEKANQESNAIIPFAVLSDC